MLYQLYVKRSGAEIKLSPISNVLRGSQAALLAQKSPDTVILV